MKQRHIDETYDRWDVRLRNEDFNRIEKLRGEKSRAGLPAEPVDLYKQQNPMAESAILNLHFRGIRELMQKDYSIRSLRKGEEELLKDFLYDAIFVPEGAEPPARNIIEKPELRVYTEDFGTRAGDNCLLAEADGNVVGAVWTRIMDDYGHVNDETPSFAISLREAYRGQGIGTQLMIRMLDLLKNQGYKRASLAVQKANYAVRMYQKVGFRSIRENAEEYIMVCEL